MVFRVKRSCGIRGVFGVDTLLNAAQQTTIYHMMTDGQINGQGSEAKVGYTTVPAEKKEHAEKFISALIKISRRFRYGVSERRGIEYVEFADRFGLNVQGSALDRLFYAMLISELKCILELVRFICVKNRHDEIPDTYELLHPNLVAEMMEIYMPLLFRKEEMVVYVETFHDLATKICKDVKGYVMQYGQFCRFNLNITLLT